MHTRCRKGTNNFVIAAEVMVRNATGTTDPAAPIGRGYRQGHGRAGRVRAPAARPELFYGFDHERLDRFAGGHEFQAELGEEGLLD